MYSVLVCLFVWSVCFQGGGGGVGVGEGAGEGLEWSSCCF